MVAAREELDPAEILEPQAMNSEGMSLMESITRGEVDMQVSTAKRFPRSLKTFKQRALTMATLDQSTAQSCFYVLPRGGKSIEGPSVRLAEIVASEWGNLRCETRVIGEDEKWVTAQSTCWDMERNLLIRREVQRRIVDKNGRRYSDDVVQQTANAACSIAFRNAVFTVVPRAHVDDIYKQARRVAVGDARTLVQQRTQWFDYWAKAGIVEARVLAMLGKPGVVEVDIDDLVKMQGLATAIKDGETTLDEAFPPEPMKEGTHGFGFKKKDQGPPPQTDADAPPAGEPAKDQKPAAKKPENRAPKNAAEEKWLADQAEKAKKEMAEEDPEPGSNG